MKTKQLFDDFAKQQQQHVDRLLNELLPKKSAKPSTLHQAMYYAVFNGGKRIRPLLSYAAAQALDYKHPLLDQIACSVELIHAYSLVHDDLPAMDDADLRRGKPSCHKAFNEAIAILAGDALQTLAFKLITESQLDSNFDPIIRIKLVSLLTKACSSTGMAGGQAIDLESSERNLTLEELEQLHRWKTGALIQASINMVAIASGLEENSAQSAALDEYALSIGLAFQIKDDLLDCESTTQELGKPKGNDEKLNKTTYPSLLGLEKAKLLLDQTHEQALNALKVFGQSAEALRQLAHYVVNRKN